MTKIKVRPYFSFSQYNAYKYSPAKFLRTYYYGEFEDSVYLQLGKRLGTALQFRQTKEIPVIQKIRQQIPEAKVYEKELKATFSDIRCIGYLDGWNPKTYEVQEYKTGKKPSEKSWREQQLMYSLLIYIKYKKLPSKIDLYWCETQFNENEQLILTGQVRKYDIKVSLPDILQFSKEMVRVYNEIQKLIENEYQMYGILPVNRSAKGRNNNQNKKHKK